MSKVVNFLKFFISKQFWINFLIVIGVIFFSIILINVILKRYTGLGESNTVPDLRELTYEQALDKYRDHPIVLLINDSSQYYSDKQPLEILGQYPDPYAQVKEDRKIYLSVNRTTPVKIEMPDVVDKSYKQAKLQLERKELVVDSLIYIPHPFKNMVVDARIDGETVVPGTMVRQGSKVHLIVGDGLSTGRLVDVPMCMGLTLKEATFIIRASSLLVGTIEPDGPITDTASAIVYLQIPDTSAQYKMRIGDPVKLFIKQDYNINEDQNGDGNVEDGNNDPDE